LTADDLRLEAGRMALLIVDAQERLAAAMPAADLAACQRNILVLVELARRLGIPIVASEQYPKGLGPTVPALREALDGAAPLRVEKIEFACTDAPAFRDIAARLDRPQWVVTGMETHVCVYQTARGLAAGGARVHVPADAVVSRSPANMRIGLDLIERTGAVVTSTETVVFDVLRRAGSDDFRALSKLVK
jgi:nicotinamidase-related amidase